MCLILVARRRSELARDLPATGSGSAATVEGVFAAGSLQIAGKPGSYARWAEAQLQRL
ncbi:MULTISPECIES: hypothetical protein [Pseudomonas]|uniref:Uncharacterized protein n=1 Tax=Phytopseudomonas flavescens TaxID=29435 RepID=A0A7Y9XQV0_9GAMM|nr:MULTISPECIES: hypothetical protein [Pseudomonas]MCW2294978.1 hypothetical protein [Pseudomonas sp. BIGb0408]NYH75748.1 hypothetical protein [Pseudomonas flavescens]